MSGAGVVTVSASYGAGGDLVKLRSIGAGNYSLPVIPGTYDVARDSGTSENWTVRTGVTVGSVPSRVTTRERRMMER